MVDSDGTTRSLYKNDEKYFGSRRSEMVDFIPSHSKKILDVGCSDGGFGSLVKEKKGAEVWGIDINEMAVNKASQVLDRSFCCDLASNVDILDDQSFDTICFNDVLEHLVDPYTLLKKIKVKIRDGGGVVASIPNVRFFRVLRGLLFKKDFEYQNDGVLDRTHLRFFTKKSIVRMFRESGYEVEVIKPINKTKSSRPWLYFIFSLGLIGSDIFYPQFAVYAKKSD